MTTMQLLPCGRLPVWLALLALAASAPAAEIRVGLVGLDTSHATAFTKLLNDPANPEHVPGAHVVAAFKAWSADVASSASRVEGYTAELKKDPTIVFYESIAELVNNVDAVMILNVDGRTHLAEARQVFVSRKPVFIDKPLAGSLREALELAEAARTAGAVWFSSSSLRENVRTALAGAKYGELRGAFAYSPAELEPHHPDLFWYGVHGVETLFTVMGRGCVSVTRTHTADADVVTGTWADGRIGTFRGTRNAKTGYGVTVFGSTSVVSTELKSGYRPLLEQIVQFFATRVVPVANEDTLECLAFMEAADESKRRGGAPVTLADVVAANQPARR
jgi:hypothetical protein